MYLHPSKQICRYISGFKIILVCYPATTEFVTGQVKLLFIVHLTTCLITVRTDRTITEKWILK